MRKFSFFIAFLLLAGNAWAVTYYVDQTGGSDLKNGQSTDNAWKTIDKVNNSTFYSGDSILLKRGEIWREQLTPPSSGNAGMPITFGAYGNGDAPILYGLDFISSKLTGWTNNRAGVYSVAYPGVTGRVTFDGSLLTQNKSTPTSPATGEWGWSGTRLYVGDKPTDHTVSAYLPKAGWVAHVTKKYIAFDGITFDGTSVLYDGIKFDTGSSYCIVVNCTIRNHTSYYDQTYASSGILVRKDSTGNTFRNNVFENNGTDPYSHNIYLAGTNNVFEHNEVSGSFGWGVQVYSADSVTSNNIVRYNYIHNNGAGSRGGGIVLDSGVGNMAYYNIVESNNYGITVDESSSGTGVYNNTIINSTRNGITLGVGSSTATVRNNIVFGSRLDNYLCNGCSDPTQDHNLLDGTNPLFVSSSDYRLQSSSPAINGGVAIVGMMSDYSGNSIKGLPDIGAYEFQGSVGVPKKPTNPTGLTIE